MDYTIRETKTYPGSVDKSLPALELAVKGLQGKILKQTPQTGQVTVWFDKTVQGHVLGERTRIEITAVQAEPDRVQINLEAYPVDPVGNKLLFGARKGVTQTVLTWFIQNLDQQMAKTS